MTNKINKKYLRAGGYTVIVSVAALAIFLLVNILVSNLPSDLIKRDLTNSGLTELSDDSIERIKTVDSDVTLYIVAESGNEDPYLKTMVERVAELNSHIKVGTKDPAVEPGFQNEHKVYFQNSLVAVGEKRDKTVSYISLFFPGVDEEAVLNYMYTQGSFPSEQLSQYLAFDGENCILSALNYVTTDNLPVAYYLSGHNEVPIPSALTKTVTEANIELRELSLIKEQGVPEDCDCLIINVPEIDLSDDELKWITEYTEKGGDVLLVTEPEADTTSTYVPAETGNSESADNNEENETTPEETAEEPGNNETIKGEQLISKPNLYKLTALYGVDTEFGVVIEENEKYTYTQPYFLIPELGTHEITSPLSGQSRLPLLPVSHAIVTLEGRESEVTPLLTTSDSAFIATEIKNTLEKQDGDKTGKFTLAVASEHETEDGKKTRLVWFGSYALLDESVNRYSLDSNFTLYVNSLAYMTEKTEAITLHESKLFESDYMQMSDSTAGILKGVFIGVIPAAVLIIGVVIYVKRRKAK